VKPARDGAPTPAAFAWTVPHRLFDACSFKVVGNPDGGKRRGRKGLSVIGSTTGAGRQRAEQRVGGGGDVDQGAGRFFFPPTLGSVRGDGR
jgi:hypothetical protein